MGLRTFPVVACLRRLFRPASRVAAGALGAMRRHVPLYAGGARWVYGQLSYVDGRGGLSHGRSKAALAIVTWNVSEQSVRSSTAFASSWRQILWIGHRKIRKLLRYPY